MLRTNIDFHNSIYADKTPEVYIVIQTALGTRAYSGETLMGIDNIAAVKYDGSRKYDGTWKYGGGQFLIENKPIVVSWGRLNRTLSPQHSTLVSGLQGKRESQLTVQLNNADRKVGKELMTDPFITKSASLYLGFEGQPFTEHLRLFMGVVDTITVDLSKVTLVIVEA